MDSSDGQSESAERDKKPTVDGMLMDRKDEHPAKARSPTEVTLRGRSTSVMPEQPWKQDTPILRILGVMGADVNCLHLWNAKSPIWST